MKRNRNIAFICTALALALLLCAFSPAVGSAAPEIGGPALNAEPFTDFAVPEFFTDAAVPSYAPTGIPKGLDGFGGLTGADGAPFGLEDGPWLYLAPGTTLKALRACGDYVSAARPDGTKLKRKDVLGSGAAVTAADGRTLTVIVKGDADGDGRVTLSDARFALRAAVELVTPNAWQDRACKVCGYKRVIAHDARLICRAAEGLAPLALR